MSSYPLGKKQIMFHKYHSGPVPEDRFLKLAAAEDIDIIEGFIPDKQVRGLGQTGRQQHFFLLPGAEIRHILIKLQTAKIQFTQDR